MATSLAASLKIIAQTDLTPDTSDSGVVTTKVDNGTDGERWTNGTSSGNADRVYRRIARSIGSGATDSYNTLAAGSLTDPLGQAIDLDEIKGFALECTSGSIRLIASAGQYMRFLQAAGDAINLSSGHMVAFSFGATGLDVTVNSLFEILETTGTGASTYNLILWGAQ